MDILGFSITQIVTFLLVLSRVGGIFTTAPIFGNANVAPMVRVAIAVCLALVFIPMSKYQPLNLDFMPLAFAVAKEALVGIIMGFLAALMFAAIQMAGAFIDMQVGFGFASVVDPMIKEQNAVIGQFQNMAATLVFLAMNGHHLMIRGLADSFAILPLGFLSLDPEASGSILKIFVVMFMAAMKIAAPIVGAVFLTDVALGILNRTVPQLNVFVVGLPAKLAICLVAMTAVLPMAVAVMTRLFGGLERDLITILKHLAG